MERAVAFRIPSSEFRVQMGRRPARARGTEGAAGCSPDSKPVADYGDGTTR
jgi:hypothetical protein